MPRLPRALLVVAAVLVVLPATASADDGYLAPTTAFDLLRPSKSSEAVGNLLKQKGVRVQQKAGGWHVFQPDRDGSQAGFQVGGDGQIAGSFATFTLADKGTQERLAVLLRNTLRRDGTESCDQGRCVYTCNGYNAAVAVADDAGRYKVAVAFTASGDATVADAPERPRTMSAARTSASAAPKKSEPRQKHLGYCYHWVTKRKCDYVHRVDYRGAGMVQECWNYEDYDSYPCLK